MGMAMAPAVAILFTHGLFPGLMRCYKLYDFSGYFAKNGKMR